MNKWTLVTILVTMWVAMLNSTEQTTTVGASTEQTTSVDASPEQTTSVGASTEQTTTEDPTTNVSCPLGEQFCEDKSDCEYFVECTEDGRCTQMLCANNTIWNPTLKICDHGTKTAQNNCTLTNLYCPMEFGLFDIPYDPKGYINCTNYIATRHKCEDNAVWNQGTTKCQLVNNSTNSQQ